MEKKNKLGNIKYKKTSILSRILNFKFGFSKIFRVNLAIAMSFLIVLVIVAFAGDVIVKEGNLIVDNYLNITNALFSDGVASLPSFAFKDDIDTGIFRPATDTLGFTTGGTNSWRITNNGHLTPTLNNTYDIGMSSKRVKTGYFIQTVVGDIVEEYSYNHDFQYPLNSLVCIDVNGLEEVKPCSSQGEGTVLGVVNRLPYTETVIIGEDENGNAITQEFNFDVLGITIYGKHKIKVNGVVNKGDLLIQGNLGGVAVSFNQLMNSDPTILRTWGYIDGRVVGRALENYNSNDVGEINAFIGGK